MQRVLAALGAKAASLRQCARPRGLTITVHLFLLAAALLVPVFVLAVSALALFLDAQQSAVRIEAEQRASTAAAFLSREFAGLEQAAQILASRRSLRDGDLERFSHEAAFDGELAFRVLVIDAGGREVLFDNAGPLGAIRPDADVREVIRQTVSLHPAGAPRVVFFPLPEHTPFFASLVPMKQGSAVKYLVAVVLAADLVSLRLKETMPPDATIILVADQRGVVVARNDDGALGISAPDWLQTLVARRPYATGRNDAPRVVGAAATYLPNQDWAVVARLASAAVVPAQRALGLFGVTAATLIGISAAAALVFARRIAHSVRSLAGLGIQLAHDPAAPRLSSPVAEVNEVGLALAKAAEIRRELELELLQAQKMEAVGRLTGGLAHDFNNLLTIIIGNLEMIAEECEAALTEDQSKLIADAQESAGLSANLVNQLLAFSRRQPLDPIVIDIGRVVQDTSHLLARTLGETIELKVDVADGLRARVDVSQFETVVLNLAINARDAMPNGGTLNIKAKRVYVTEAKGTTLRLPPGRYVGFSMTDTGTGMTREVRERAFEPFFTTKPPGIGTGLGLSVVYGFAKQSGGDAWIRSEVGRGTTVEFWIPEADALPTVATPAIRIVPSERVRGGAATILLVDDNAKVREVAARALRLRGFSVLEAADGPSALDLLERERSIDVLFTDFIMPGGMRGDDLAQIAVALKPEICVLYTSGYADVEVEHKEVGGKVLWLPKPYTNAQLAAALEKLLNAAASSPCEIA